MLCLKVLDILWIFKVNKLDGILLFCKDELIGFDCVPRCLFDVSRTKVAWEVQIYWSHCKWLLSICQFECVPRTDVFRLRIVCLILTLFQNWLQLKYFAQNLRPKDYLRLVWWCYEGQLHMTDNNLTHQFWK